VQSPRSVPRLALLSLALAVLTLIQPTGHTQPKPEVSLAAPNSPQQVLPLSRNSSDSQELSGGASRAYEIELRAGDYLRVVVDKGDLSLKATLVNPEGLRLNEFVGHRYGSLRVAFVAPAAGRYRLGLTSLEDEAALRRYDLHVAEIRKASTRDRADERAAWAYAEAERLRDEWSAHSFRVAIDKYAEAVRGWLSVSYTRDAAAALESLGEAHFTLGRHASALRSYKDALKASRAAGDRRGEIRALNAVAYVYLNLGDNQSALARCREAQARQAQASRAPASADEVRDEAQTVNNLGEISYSVGELKEALDSFARALDLWTRVGDRRGQALAHLNLGYTQSDGGDLPKAFEHFRQSLALWRAVGDRRGEALSQTALGAINSFVGERQSALDAYRRALEIFRAFGDQQGEAVALNSVGQVYEDLNDLPTALDHYKLALELNRRSGNRDFEAVTGYYVGRVYRLMGDTAQALSYYGQSLRLSRRLGKQRVAAYAFTDIGAIYDSLGQRQFALDQYKEVLKFYREAGDRRGQANTLKAIGDLHYSAGERALALACYKESLAFSLAAWDRSGEAEALYRIARVERDGGEIDRALARAADSIKIIEAMRSQVASLQLRASYFTSIQKHYDLYIALLMRLHELRPTSGYAATAMQASERARARSLVETLLEADADVRLGVEPALLNRERTLQRALSAKAAYVMRLRNSAQTEGDAEQIEKEIRLLTNEYEEVQAQIRSQSPRYAGLMQPRPPSLEDIQAELRGDDTVLLEYALGEEKSYLWVVAADSFSSHELPGRARIEELAREVYSLLTVRPGDAAPADQPPRADESGERYWKKAAELSAILFSPLASRLGRQRLLVVADGALQYVPFEALPAPAAVEASGAGQLRAAVDPVPLVLRHEIVYLPSASTLIALRREDARPSPATKSVFVLADPVFDRGDPRVKLAAPRNPSAGGSNSSSPAPKDVGGDYFPRLPSTRHEADVIASLAPEDGRTVATDFAASRATALGAELGHYRIVHIATHSVVNNRQPALSGIVLSLVNERGEDDDGFLQLHDIYGLKLGANLVVLSACDTGLGKEVRGEGLVGLTRGFMYAGAPSVVASMWKVDDSASAELMTHFYRAMFEDGQPPAAALRSAKEKMWRQKHWRAPHYWSAFVLQGEYRSRREGWHGRAFAAATAVFAALAALAVLAVALTRHARRRAFARRTYRAFRNQE
jgi:CHAT domain-containing protein